CRLTVPLGVAQAMQMVPTGLRAVPPPGPAMPLVARATSHPRRARAPSAISRTVASLTAPCWARVSALTPRRASLISLS
nr:hypothetical protein [Tanacetum cinerariifolium]